MGRASRTKKERRIERNNLVVYWYTTMLHMKVVGNEGIIKPYYNPQEPNERGAVFLSTNQNWERREAKQLPKEDGELTPPLNRDELFDMGIMPIRARVNPASLKLIDWKTFRKKSGIATEKAEMIDKLAREDGAIPEQWYASFEAIPVTSFLSVDVWDGSQWVQNSVADERDRQMAERAMAVGEN
jgi:hypothetical protein